jgi:hypothetical protein
MARLGGHKGAQTSNCPSQSPSPSFDTARPDVPPWAKVSGSQTDILTPWYDGRAEIIPFRYLPVLLGGKERGYDRSLCEQSGGGDPGG